MMVMVEIGLNTVSLKCHIRNGTCHTPIYTREMEGDAP